MKIGGETKPVTRRKVKITGDQRGYEPVPIRNSNSGCRRGVRLLLAVVKEEDGAVEFFALTLPDKTSKEAAMEVVAIHLDVQC
ncbi:hypothetical protein HHK36_010927 [Tetracentron sinense]|uniref:Uncharacterized protein n=1 Tax=Tetracentron sinense TaxID=13715 RepID=A0A834ZB70_TETSI|nr:hypothetical protein HHK36_010927 [Tetracentron sinense]